MIQVEPYIYDEPITPYERRMRAHPWRVTPDLAKQCMLGELLALNFVGVMAAHILAHDKTATPGTVVKYQNNYRKSGGGNIWDVECNGVLYRHHAGRIHTKKVSN